MSKGFEPVSPHPFGWDELTNSSNPIFIATLYKKN